MLAKHSLGHILQLQEGTPISCDEIQIIPTWNHNLTFISALESSPIHCLNPRPWGKRRSPEKGGTAAILITQIVSTGPRTFGSVIPFIDIIKDLVRPCLAIVIYQFSLSAHLCRAPILLRFLLRFSLLCHPSYSYLNPILSFTLWIILIFLSYPCPYSDIPHHMIISPIFVTMTLYSYVSDYRIPYFLRTSI